MTTYLVEVSTLGNGTATSRFKTRVQALDAAFLALAALDWPNRYIHTEYLRVTLQRVNNAAAGIHSSKRDWSVKISKVR